MLRDMTDSRRIDQHVQAQKAVSVHLVLYHFIITKSLMQVPLHPTIISRHFWPPLQTNSFTMPGQFRE